MQANQIQKTSISAFTRPQDNTVTLKKSCNDNNRVEILVASLNSLKSLLDYQIKLHDLYQK